MIDRHVADLTGSKPRCWDVGLVSEELRQGPFGAPSKRRNLKYRGKNEYERLRGDKSRSRLRRTGGERYGKQGRHICLRNELVRVGVPECA